jgi:hypothetical protein
MLSEAASVRIADADLMFSHLSMNLPDESS